MAEVVTGEAVVLEVPCARFPSRLLAFAIDVVIQLVIFVVLLLLVGAGQVSGVFDPASAAAVGITVIVAVLVGYPVIWETLSRGRSPGKFALGLRVISDDGSPERFRQALVRGLAAIVEIWSVVGLPIALFCSMLSSRGKRLGDMFAGTFVIQQRVPARSSTQVTTYMVPHLAAWAVTLELSGLTEQTAETARRYLARARELGPAARAELAQRIAADVRAQVSPPPPPGTSDLDYLTAVLAERRGREQSKLGWTPLPPQPPAGKLTPDTPTADSPAQNPGGFAPPR
ncbi:MAG TPA: RDD family protein [Streptosporangiaceae bacterium]|nr:RDD family protein [Streptosporangiaceae bacterium]